MHIEFKLPTGAGGMAALHWSNRLKQRIVQWAAERNITVEYYNGTAYRLCFEFEKPSDYTLFALSWTVNSEWDHYNVINN